MMTDKERNELIAQKLNEGMSLSDVQKLLSDEHGLRITFLDLRLIAADLSVDWQKHDKPKAPVPAEVVAAPAADAGAGETAALTDDEDVYDEDDDEVEDGGAEDDEVAAAREGDADDDATDADDDGSGTRVTLDAQPRRGTAMSGAVRFASGLHGGWYMDQTGRLGLQLAEGQEGQPSEDDIRLFQTKLSALLQKMQDDLAREAAEGKTKVDVSPVVRPGAMFSGDVEFASGAKGEWTLDQSGRLGFQLGEGSAKPTPRDMQLFQMELQRVLQNKGL
ncbi:MAG: hypothetical protein PHT80_04355 [Lentisphaeria bacterium]|nr:hypothetical protein [Lentisphaeria bacterium]